MYRTCIIPTHSCDVLAFFSECIARTASGISRPQTSRRIRKWLFFFGKMKPGRSKWVHNQSTSRVTVNDKRIHLACMIIPQENYGIDHQLSRSNMVKPHLSLSIVKREREREWTYHPRFHQVAWDPRKQGKLCERCGLSSAAWVAPRWWVPHGRPGRGG